MPIAIGWLLEAFKKVEKAMKITITIRLIYSPWETLATIDEERK